MQDENFNENLSLTDEETPLPEGWGFVKLGKVCRIVGGSTPSSGVPEFWNGEIVWITPTDLGKLDKPYIETSQRQITQKGYESCATELLPTGSVVMSSRAPIGHLGIAQIPLCTNQGCKSFVVSEEIDSKFLYYLLKISVPAFQELGSGSTFAEISKSSLESFEIPLPPTIEEQRQIAAILDEQMKAVGAARAAVEEQLAAARLLPNAFLRSALESDDTQNWQETIFENVAVLQRGYDLPTQDQVKGEYPIITSSGIMGTHNEFREYAPGVVTGRSGSIGKIFYTEQNYFPHNTALFIKDFKGNHPRYIYYLLHKINLKNVASGSGVPTLDRKEVHKLSIKHPNLETQIKIAEKLDEQIQAVETLKQSLTEKLEAVKKLPAVLLRKAFAGEF